MTNKTIDRIAARIDEVLDGQPNCRPEDERGYRDALTWVLRLLPEERALEADREDDLNFILDKADDHLSEVEMEVSEARASIERIRVLRRETE